MTTMNISLPDEMKAFVEAQMTQEGYASASEYLRALIREAQKRRAKHELEAKGLSRNNLNSSSLLTPTGSNNTAQGRRRRTLGVEHRRSSEP